MIKFDKDVLQALKTLEKEGFETYAIGNCVTQTVRGVQTFDWDLTTKASAEELKAIFPQGKFIKADQSVMRVDFTHEEDGEETGSIMDLHIITGPVEDELAKEVFTVQAMADNPDRRFVDPYDGRNDIKRGLIRTIGNADELFKKDPIRMMEAVALASEMSFDLQKDVFDGILSNWRLLLDYDVNPIRENLERVLTGESAGKGLKLMAESGLMAVVLGEEVSKKMSHNDMKMFEVLCENIQKTRPVTLRRMGLLYTCLGEKAGLAAIERLNFPPEEKVHLVDAMTYLIKIQFLSDPIKFKRFLYEIGMDRYNYLHNLGKAQRIVYDYTTLKVESRNIAMQQIVSGKEAVFVEDLVIDANDIMEAGITDDPEKAEKLLHSVVALVHKNPNNNHRETLLKYAKKYSKNKLAEQLRYVNWFK